MTGVLARSSTLANLAGVAQLEEQPPCKRQVVGSNPSASSAKSAPRGGSNDNLMRIMLSERDMAVLDFERSAWLIQGPKLEAIQEQLSMSPTKYYKILRSLADDSDAAVYDPMTVRRLQASGRREQVRRLQAAGDS